jgi:hypothetical protein
MMEWLRLAVAVLLPWLGGYLWLAVLEQRWNRRAPDRLRQLGYSLFVGYAGLQGIVLASNASTGEIELWRINVVLVQLTLAAGLLLLRGKLAADRTVQSLPAGPPDIDDQSSRFLNYLFWLLGLGRATPDFRRHRDHPPPCVSLGRLAQLDVPRQSLVPCRGYS